MKFMIVSTLADIDDTERSKILAMYAEHGTSAGVEGLWVTADGGKVVQLVDVDDLTEFSKFANLYKTAFESDGTTWYPLIDAAVAVGQQTGGIEARAGG